MISHKFVRPRLAVMAYLLGLSDSDSARHAERMGESSSTVTSNKRLVSQAD